MASSHIAAPDLVGLAAARRVRRDLTDTALWHYRADRNEADAEPRKILMVHGFRGDHHGLEAIAGALSDFEILIPDLPGYGKTAALESAKLTDYRDWLIALNREIAADIVLGHSFGSLVVASAGDALAARQLVLVNPVANRSLERRDLANRIARLYYRAAAKGGGDWLLRNQLAVDLMSITLATSPDRALRRWIHRSHRRYFSAFAHSEVAVSGFWAAAENSITDFAAEITTPTLLVAADRDQISSLDEVSALHGKFLKAELDVLTDVGHLLHYERPAEVAERVRKFTKID